MVLSRRAVGANTDAVRVHLFAMRLTFVMSLAAVQLWHQHDHCSGGQHRPGRAADHFQVGGAVISDGSLCGWGPEATGLYLNPQQEAALTR